MIKCENLEKVDYVTDFVSPESILCLQSDSSIDSLCEYSPDENYISKERFDTIREKRDFDYFQVCTSQKVMWGESFNYVGDEKYIIAKENSSEPLAYVFIPGVNDEKFYTIALSGTDGIQTDFEIRKVIEPTDEIVQNPSLNSSGRYVYVGDYADHYIGCSDTILVQKFWVKSVAFGALFYTTDPESVVSRSI